MLSDNKHISIEYDELKIFDEFGNAKILEKYNCVLGKNGATITGNKESIKVLSDLINISFNKNEKMWENELDDKDIWDSDDVEEEDYV